MLNGNSGFQNDLLEDKVKSNSSGTACVYYNKPAPVRTVNFPVQHDDKWHEYEVEIPVTTLSALRIDPARSLKSCTI